MRKTVNHTRHSMEQMVKRGITVEQLATVLREGSVWPDHQNKPGIIQVEHENGVRCGISTTGRRIITVEWIKYTGPRHLSMRLAEHAGIEIA